MSSRRVRKRMQGMSNRLSCFFPHAEPVKTRYLEYRNLICLIAMVMAMISFSFFVKSGQATEVFRVGFTIRAFGGVNENDAMAAVRAWAQAFVTERKIQAITEPAVYRNLSEIEEALSGGSVDAITMTIVEYAKMKSLVADDAVICGVISGSITEEYLLLVNRKSNIRKLSDLKGGMIGILSSQRAALTGIWLDTLLLREGLEPADSFFKRVDTSTKVSNLLIPLFFGKLDAGLVTRRGFDIMVELNPQTGEQLKVLASSEPLVPTAFCFRKNYNSSIRKQILNEIQRWHLSPAGKQSLTIFQTDSLKEEPIGCLDGAMELIAEHQRLLFEESHDALENQ